MKDLSQQIIHLPQSPGVYLFKDQRKKVIYIGKAKNLLKRVRSYFQKSPQLTKTEILVRNIAFIDFIPVDTELEALLLEANLIKKNQPKYNVILKDDKHYIYIKITREEFPKVLYARRKDDINSEFFGPFPQASTVKEIIGLLRRIFPFCNQKRNSKRVCFYRHIGLCLPCPVEIRKLSGENYRRQKELYRRNIFFIKKVLTGSLKKVRLDLINQMKQLSREENFEEAAQIRNKINGLDYISQNYHSPESYLINPNALNQIRRNEQIKLAKLLNNYYTQLKLPKIIECYDISNISGKFAVGSLVTFIDGEPEKTLYKRFRIKTKFTPDDFAMLKEVVKRRLKHKEWNYPDLLVVDGGTPQLSTMLSVLNEQKIDIPLIGLAKREEEIIIPSHNRFVHLNLEEGSPELSLIQRLRDEAHRFAHRYHELLRLKYLLS